MEPILTIGPCADMYVARARDMYGVKVCTAHVRTYTMHGHVRSPYMQDARDLVHIRTCGMCGPWYMSVHMAIWHSATRSVCKCNQRFTPATLATRVNVRTSISYAHSGSWDAKFYPKFIERKMHFRNLFRVYND